MTSPTSRRAPRLGRSLACRGLIPPILLALTALLLATPVTRANGVPDQVNNPPATTTYSCGAAGVPVSQSFTPAAPTVVAVEVFLRAGGGFPAEGVDLHARLLALDGTALGAATTRMAGPVRTGASVVAHFDFPAPVVVTPGMMYRLEWETQAAAVLTWFGTDGDPYPRGEAYSCGGTPITGRDYNFATYGPDATLTPTATPCPTPRPSPSPTPALPVCPQIRGRVPTEVIDTALADPGRVAGYGQLERPGLPPGPYNRPRTWLSLAVLARPYDPLSNGLVYRGGCP